MFEATPGKPNDTTRSGGAPRRFDAWAYQARCSRTRESVDGGYHREVTTSDQQPLVRPPLYQARSADGVTVRSNPFAGHSDILKTLAAKRAMNLLRLKLLGQEAAGGRQRPTL